ncbi:response regulator transcription factor [Bacillus suaedae]|uniref:Response regulator transcription factor n=1 Tax=Halalkalibacter suaedae TaxID=2822140 RepID=A0A941AQV1_9BACI|nr:response regulator transcription factor [Bacillus suaedae]MBP3951658.1 response regulator transcription factor [Bacillus suaedae]
MNNTTILVVDDEVALLDLVTSFLKKEYNVITTTSGMEAIQLIQTKAVDLIILDVMMEKMDGFTACEKIREISSVPVLMLTARSGEEDKIRGLKLGADDYIVKPFSPRELVARVEAVLRRSSGQKAASNIIKFQDLELDKSGRMVYVNHEPVNVTKKEYDLLLFLLEHHGQVFSREHLHDRIWGMDAQMGTLRTVDTHIKTLRLKLKSGERYIKTVWGVGYKFEGGK